MAPEYRTCQGPCAMRQPIWRFREKPGRGGVIYHSNMCKRCEGHAEDLKKARDRFRPKATTFIRSHIPRWVEKGHIPERLDLPPKERMAAYKKYVADRYRMTTARVADQMRVWYGGNCQGPCEQPFSLMPHATRDMEMDQTNPASTPEWPSAFGPMCHTCHKQKLNTDPDRYGEELFWDRKWKDAINAPPAYRGLLFDPDTSVGVINDSTAEAS